MSIFREKSKYCRACGITRRAATAKLAVLLAVVLAAAAVMPGAVYGAAGASDKTKSETVYAVLVCDGSYSGATVVNRFTTGGEIVDYGAYASIENLMGPDAPVIDGDVITWPASATGDGGFFYQGETDKALPVDIGITYYLNGKEIASDDISGKTGELEIAFDIENVTGTGEMDELADREIMTPFAVQVSLALDDDTFTVKDLPKNASDMLTGSTRTVSHTSFPLPNDSFSFTMFGQDIALEPINIIALPKAPPGLDAYGDFVDTDGMMDGIDEMSDGTDEMIDGTAQLLDGLYEMRDAADDLSDAMADMDSGAASLADGASAVHGSARTLAASARDFSDGISAYAAGFAEFDAGMDALLVNVEAMALTLESLSASAAQLDAGVIGMGDGIDGVAETNDYLVYLATILVKSYPNEKTAEILAELTTQQAVIDALALSCTDLELLSAGVSSGNTDFYTEFSTTFLGSVSALRASSAALYATCLELLDAADSLSSGCSSLSGAIGDLEDGADDLAGGISAMRSELPALTDGIDDMIDGVIDLDDGLAALSDDGLGEMRDTLDGLDGYLETLTDMAAAYGSFMDVRNAPHCTVQFVMKTQAIGNE